VIIIFEINRLGLFEGGIQYTEMKMNRNFDAFTDLLKSLDLEVPTICLATGCVSGRRDRRYSSSETHPGSVTTRNSFKFGTNFLAFSNCVLRSLFIKLKWSSLIHE
jgi:hypothetical protein